jgi:hypothetical protein
MRNYTSYDFDKMMGMLSEIRAKAEENSQKNDLILDQQKQILELHSMFFDLVQELQRTGAFEASKTDNSGQQKVIRKVFKNLLKLYLTACTHSGNLDFTAMTVNSFTGKKVIPNTQECAQFIRKEWIEFSDEFNDQFPSVPHDDYPEDQKHNYLLYGIPTTTPPPEPYLTA